MKTILVDAIHCLIDKEGNVFDAMHQLLETFPNEKLILTGANDEESKMFKLNQAPYPVFTLKHNPEKTDPEYYRTLLAQNNLTADGVVYFEHDTEAVTSAQSVGIETYQYDTGVKDLDALQAFLASHL